MPVSSNKGPRSADRGINALRVGDVYLFGSLQWGRDQLIAELNALGLTTSRLLTTLQWGRDQLIAEFMRGSLPYSFRSPLQWGRDQLIAEFHRHSQRTFNAPRFNGAAIS